MCVKCERNSTSFAHTPFIYTRTYPKSQKNMTMNPPFSPDTRRLIAIKNKDDPTVRNKK